MVDVELDTDQFAGLEYFFDDWSEAWRDEMGATLATAAEVLRGWLEDYTPRGKTGTTATSWRVIAFDRDNYEIMNTNEPIITFLTEGTRAHPIFAHPLSGWLHWTDDDGFDHFAHYVHHPGTAPIDIVGQALEAADSELNALWDAAEESADRDVGFD